LAAIPDRGDGRLARGSDWETFGVAEQARKLLPFGFSPLASLVSSTPPVEVVAEPTVVVGHSAESLIASERRQRVEVVRFGWLGKRFRSAGAASEGLQTLEERCDLRALLTGLVWNIRCREQSPHGEALADSRRLVLFVKGDLADLVGRELSWSGQVFVVQGRADVAGGQEREDGAID